jgi:hypothetical protein
MNQDQLKEAVAREALKYVQDPIVGVGSGSTVFKFIEALAQIKNRIDGAVAASEASAERLRKIGIRVMDLGQFIAMPFCTLWLAWLGAEVIVIESRRRFTSRTAPPFAEGHGRHPDASGYFNFLYGSKKSCTVDMTTAQGRDLVRQLAAKCDIVVDNFSTGVLEKLGLSYDAISKLNPSIIMASNGAFGRTGPMRNARGLHSGHSLTVADVRARKPKLPVVMRATASQPLIRCVPHESFDTGKHLVEPWATQVAAWIEAGKRPYFFMHAPDDTYAPQNAYAFHAMLRGVAGPPIDVGELPPWPGTPRQLGLF